MKDAETRASELAELLGISPDESVYGSILRVLKEHARDQRHMCAEAVVGMLDDAEYNRHAQREAHAAALNAADPIDLRDVVEAFDRTTGKDDRDELA